jgi:hypothetical protein
MKSAENVKSNGEINEKRNVVATQQWHVQARK